MSILEGNEIEIVYTCDNCELKFMYSFTDFGFGGGLPLTKCEQCMQESLHSKKQSWDDFMAAVKVDDKYTTLGFSRDLFTTVSWFVYGEKFINKTNGNVKGNMYQTFDLRAEVK